MGYGTFAEPCPLCYGTVEYLGNFELGIDIRCRTCHSIFTENIWKMWEALQAQTIQAGDSNERSKSD